MRWEAWGKLFGDNSIILLVSTAHTWWNATKQFHVSLMETFRIQTAILGYNQVISVQTSTNFVEVVLLLAHYSFLASSVFWYFENAKNAICHVGFMQLIVKVDTTKTKSVDFHGSHHTRMTASWSTSNCFCYQIMAQVIRVILLFPLNKMVWARVVTFCRYCSFIHQYWRRVSVFFLFHSPHY